MKTLYLDCSSGISGDMLLAGLIDLGLDISRLEGILEKAGLSVRLRGVMDVRHGLSGNRLEIEAQTTQPLRRLENILPLLNKLPLPPDVIRRSRQAFERLALVEAKVHGVNPEDIHFHEVGAVDTLVDVVGAFWGVHELEIAQVCSGPLPWFRGQVQCAHGLLPLPAPAVVELLQGKPIYPTAHSAELITPTGALLLDCLVDEFCSGPQGTLLGCGIGLGSMELDTQPNALRCMLIQPFPTSSPRKDLTESAPLMTENMVLLSTNIDHLTGEELGSCFEALIQAGAADVLFLPGIMKKNRPGGQLQVLCRPDRLGGVQQAMFRHTLSLGLRRQSIERIVLERRNSEEKTPLGALNVKFAQVDGEEYGRPEFEALQELARRTGRSVAQLRYLLNPVRRDDQN